MADLVIVEANVKPATESCRLQAATYGQTVLKGELVYFKPSDGLYWKADADTDAESLVVGLAIVGGVAADVGIVAIGGNVTLGAVMTAGVDYYLSATAGKICPRADLVTGDYITRLGTSSTTSVIKIQIDKTRVAVP